MRFLKFLILLFIIFISCEKEEEEHLPRFNGTDNGSVTEYHCPCYENFYCPPCEWTPSDGSISADGVCSLSFEDERYHLQFEATLTYSKIIWDDFYDEDPDTIFFSSEEFLVDEKGAFKYNIRFKPQSWGEDMFGFPVRISRHYEGSINFYPDGKNQYGANFNTNEYLEINYLVDIVNSIKFCEEWTYTPWECIKETIRTEYPIVLSFDSDCWDSFLEF